MLDVHLLKTFIFKNNLALMPPDPRSLTPTQAELIGKIILAKFLKLSPVRFEKFIDEAEGYLLFNALSEKGTIVIKQIEGAEKAASCDGMSHDAVGIIGSAPYFTIRYRHPGFGKEYLFNGDSRLFEKGEALMRKLRLITDRNRITHEILNAVFIRQRDYFHSGSPLDLKPLSRAEIALAIRAGNGADPVIDASRISRLIDGKTVGVPSGGEKPFKFFFPTGRDIHRRAISALMDEERKELAAGKLKRPFNDKEIRDRLKQRHGLAITRRQVGFCRKELGIPNLYRRKVGSGYSSERSRFSAACRLDTDTVKKNAPSVPGVYEFSLVDVRIEYPNGADSVFYIGSAGNIRKRLKEHLKSYNKNGGIRGYLEKYNCLFRYIVLGAGWQKEEKMLYDLFAADFGVPPRCNRASPPGRLCRNPHLSLRTHDSACGNLYIIKGL